MAEAVAIHVIDDDVIIRELLSALLSAADYDVQTYESPRSFLERLPTLASGCILTDVRMPDMTGLQLLQHIRARLKDFPTIVLTAHADVPLAVEALKSGALDLIEKPIDSIALLKAVREAVQSLSRTVEENQRKAQCAHRISALTARERDVLRGLVAGWSNKVIGRELEISPRTVENYRANLMVKMQASSLSELVQMTCLSEGQSS
ncbi:response regulator FixJ [Phenylobacterium sp. LjRoot225]|uniref:response regulator FixJ n=1 Tax=Phenylobacterium sp. LjRoot225 TaxID=3342285 RepID=UPI003ECDF098